MAFGVPDAARGGKQLIGDIMMVGAGAAWGATTLVIKGSTLRTAPAEKVFAYQIGGLDPDAGARRAAHGRAHDSHAERLGARLARLPDVLGGEPHLAVWFALVQRYSASRLSAFTFLTPLFGVASGHFVLGEPISWAFGVAVALVIGRTGAGEPAELTGSEASRRPSNGHLN